MTTGNGETPIEDAQEQHTPVDPADENTVNEPVGGDESEAPDADLAEQLREVPSDDEDWQG